jgi:photosystem II stability/assembly factor-like uncharacterized protein
MKRIALVGIIALVVGMTSTCASNSNTFTRNSVAAGKQIPRVVLAGPRQLTDRESIFSVALRDDGNVFSVQNPIQDVVHFDFGFDGSFHVVNRVASAAEWSLWDLGFANPMVGFAVGSHGTVLKTDDGGLSWNRQLEFTTLDLTEVAFLNPSIGYIAGKESIIDPETGALRTNLEIWKTDDGGRSWAKVYHDDKESAIFRIRILSPDVAVALVSGERLIRTTNGGKTWDDVFVGSRLADFAFGLDRTGWLVGTDLAFLKSENYGLTWQAVDNFPPSIAAHKWSAISIGRTGNGLAVSEDGRIAYSLDNGRSWEILSNQFDESLREVQVERDVGIILGSHNIYRVSFRPSNEEAPSGAGPAH